MVISKYEAEHKLDKLQDNLGMNRITQYSYVKQINKNTLQKITIKVKRENIWERQRTKKMNETYTAVNNSNGLENYM